MHIPDGYLSPQTAGAMYIISAPFLVRATKKIKNNLNSKMVPYISVFSALIFVIMMFNIPLPGGTTGHATGAVIASIILGPWAGMLAVSVALCIQAFFFGDGGILALGANVFNMGIVMPLAGFYIYKLLTENFGKTNRRKAVFAAIAGYISLNIGALLTGIELGIQPLLYKNNAGQALYFPFNLSVSIPAMMIGHLLIAGFAEALVTGLLVTWLLRVQPQLIYSEKEETGGKLNRWVMVLFALLILVTPLGLLAPGTAWGEWGRQELTTLGLGYIPADFDKWSNFWHPPIPGYDIPGVFHPSVIYILSAIFGVIMSGVTVYIFLLLIKKIAARKKINSE